MTDTEKAALERRIDELCAEVERLRGQVASLVGRSIRVADKMDCLNTENAKLRELLSEAREELADMYGYMDGGYAWPSIAEDPSYGPFYRKLCEALGIEVEP